MALLIVMLFFVYAVIGMQVKNKDILGREHIFEICCYLLHDGDSEQMIY